jgi:tRNA-dihydrouridine synthase B
MKRSLELRNVSFSPPLFCAPMADITHSAFRRLMAGFGGYGALYTELLAGRQLVREDPNTSTYLKRRPEEGKVIYQLLLAGGDKIPDIIGRVVSLSPAGIDINCGCGGQDVRRVGGGVALFQDRHSLEEVLRSVRREYSGLITVKTRLGQDLPDWEKLFVERLRIMEDCGVDGITVHPRFANQYRKRSARHELFSWIAGNTRLPVIANGDITGPETIAKHPEHFKQVAGIMAGRMAAAKPWLFAAWDNPEYKVDYLETWNRFYKYLLEDFEPHKATDRLKLFAKYYARNFLYGHFFYTTVGAAHDLASMNEKAVEFLSAAPAIDSCPSMSGI